MLDLTSTNLLAATQHLGFKLYKTLVIGQYIWILSRKVVKIAEFLGLEYV